MSKENNDNNKNKDVRKTESKSSKKQIRFQITRRHSDSLDSYDSAHSSLHLQENDEEEREKELYQPGTSTISFIDLFDRLSTQDIIKVSQYNPCFTKNPYDPDIEAAAQDTAALSSAGPSRQLLQISKKFSAPSDLDMNLINWTYLRKLEGVKDAIRRGANVNTFKDKQTPLLICAETGEHRLVAYLLTIPNINPNIQNVFGETPLLIAVRNAFGKIVKLLLKHKADVNKADYMGRTPLQIALFQKRPRLAKLLLAFGADYEKEDCFGERPMYTSAVKRPHLGCLLVLLRVGANPEYYNASGMTLLARTILNFSTFQIIKTLIRFGASVNSEDLYSRKTPLHFAALVNDVEITNYLLSHGANANKTTIYNFTPFDEAVFYKSLEVAEILLNYTKKPKLRALNALRNEINAKKSSK